MNKITNLSWKVVGQARVGQIIATSCAVSVLTLGVVAPSDAATLGTYKFLITGDQTSGSSDDYNGKWEFDVSLDKDTNKVSLKIVGVNDSSNDEFLNVVYMYDATLVSAGKYSFRGSDIGTPAPNSDYDLRLTGMLNHTTGSLMIDNSVTSRHKDIDTNPNVDQNIYKFDFRVCTPEPTSILSFLTLGTLGAASTLKRKLKPSKLT